MEVAVGTLVTPTIIWTALSLPTNKWVKVYEIKLSVNIYRLWRSLIHALGKRRYLFPDDSWWWDTYDNDLNSIPWQYDEYDSGPLVNAIWEARNNRNIVFIEYRNMIFRVELLYLIAPDEYPNVIKGINNRELQTLAINQGVFKKENKGAN